MLALNSYGSCDAWSNGELPLDVEAAHLMAPYAKITLAVTPADTEIQDDYASNISPPEMMKSLEYLATNHLANAVSISTGSYEGQYANGGVAEIHANDPGFLAAAAAGIPVTVATGDYGVLELQNKPGKNGQRPPTTTGPAVYTWSDSPWVTALGGSIPTESPATAASASSFPLWAEEGAGYSTIYPRPAFQNGVKSVTGSSMRSLPDITMDSADGTSQAAPTFAGILALATQINKGNLGPVNGLLYDVLGQNPGKNGIVDVTTGNNDARTIPGNRLVRGFTAGPGFDVASGWGTVDASRFAPALAAAAAAQQPSGSMAAQAGKELKKLQATLQLSPSATVSRAGAVNVTATGFLPGHPVTLTVDGRTIAKLTADGNGVASYSLAPAKANLSNGRHTLGLTSMLLEQSHPLTIHP